VGDDTIFVETRHACLYKLTQEGITSRITCCGNINPTFDSGNF